MKRKMESFNECEEDLDEVRDVIGHPVCDKLQLNLHTEQVKLFPQ